jgi:3-hydroxyacyl-[acyl-carrier-protein] dehydratase
MLEITEIMQILKHRYPFLLIDKVLDITDNKKVIALKCVTINEAFFQGHFPNQAIMPAALIIEAMAQTCAILTMQQVNSWGVLASINNAFFTKSVIPGDKLILESQPIQKLKNLVKFKSQAKVNDEIVARAEMGLVIFQEKHTINRA